MLTGFGHSSTVKIARLVEIIVVHFLKNVVQKIMTGVFYQKFFNDHLQLIRQRKIFFDA
jgi:hypothetical protein